MGNIYSIVSKLFWNPISESELLFKCVKENDYKTLESMIRRGANASIFNEEGFSLLHCAAELGHQQCVQTLLFYSCIDVNTRDKSETPMGPLGTTALHLAAAESWPQIVISLIENGADINATTITGWTPLHYLIITDNMTNAKLETLAVLIGLGADVNRRDCEGNVALNMAILYGHLEATRILLNSCVDLENIDSIDPNFLKKDEVFRCVQLCLSAGGFKFIEKYEIIKYLIEGSELVQMKENEDLLEKIDKLLSLKYNVQSLKYLCRISIRKLYSNHNLNLIIDRIPVPDILRWYILLINNNSVSNEFEGKQISCRDIHRRKIFNQFSETN